MTTQTAGRTLSHRIGPDGLLVLRLHDGEAPAPRDVSGEIATVRSPTAGCSKASRSRPANAVCPSPRAAASRSLAPTSRTSWASAGGRPGTRRRTTELELESRSAATVIVEGASADLEAEGCTATSAIARRRATSSCRRPRTLAADTVSGDLEIDHRRGRDLAARSVSGDLDAAGRLARRSARDDHLGRPASSPACSTARVRTRSRPSAAISSSPRPTTSASSSARSPAT